jgi:CHAT domain-containing protein/tetratricopeptide (TPR) repeat protein
MTRRVGHSAGCALLLAALACHVSGHTQPAGPDRRASSPTAAIRPLDSLVGEGERIYMRGEYDSARRVWRTALARSRGEGDSVAQARTLTWLGLAAWRLGEYAEARRLGEQALELKRRWMLEGELSKSYNALGLLDWNQGRLGEAAALFGQALAAAQAAGDPKAAASASGNLALVQTELGDFDGARRGFDSMRVAAHALGDARIEGNAHTNLGMLFVRMGQPRSAIPELVAARGLYRSADYPTGEENALAQLGTAYTALGVPHLALAALDSALALSRTQGLRQEEAANLEALAGVYRDAGDLWRSLGLLAKAGAINRELDLTVEAAADARDQATIQASLGSVESARKLGEKALAGHRAVDDRYEELSDLLVLADLADQAGSAAAADSCLAQAQGLARRMDGRLGRAEVALAAARLADHRGQPATVLAVLHAAGGDLGAGGYEAEQEAFLLRARSLARFGRLDAAVAASRHAVESLERIRGRYVSDYLQTTYLSNHRSAYGELAELLLRQGHPDQALEVADAARGHAFLSYTSTLDPASAAPSDPSAERLLSRAATLSHELEDAERSLAANDTVALSRVKRLDRLVGATRDDYEELLVRQGEIGAGDLARPRRDEMREAELRHVLTLKETLIEYQPLPDSVLVFIVRHDTIAALSLAVSSSRLVGHVRFARGLMARPYDGAAPARPALEWLYRELIDPIRAGGWLTGTSELLVVPRGVLTYLPFAALRNPDTGRYLAQDYSLRMLPSAAAEIALSDNADRVTGDRAAAPRVLAPLPEALPRTVAEVQAVARLLPGAEVGLGARVDEPALRAALTGGGLVHLATHAVMNRRNPMFSRIVVAPGKGRSPDDDGELDVHEILHLKLTSPLVFLSGCETGLGPGWSTDFAPGEDYATLAQAFLVAGARNVIATLWEVEDSGAAEFATQFYRNLASMPAAAALAATQRQMISSVGFAAPYYWAGYVLNGDGRVSLH